MCLPPSVEIAVPPCRLRTREVVASEPPFGELVEETV